MSEYVLSTTDANFENDVIKSTVPVLVDFWAEWCGPCKMIAPVLEEVGKDYQSRLKIVKVNVDQNSQMPSQYGVRGIPTLILFKNGDVAATKVGALNKTQLTAFLEENI